jgi:predicted nucleic acid-binding protein
MAVRRVLAREPAPRRYVGRPREAFVVDASICAAWLLTDEATDYTAAALQATAATNVWVPTLWLLEMANLLHNAQRRRRIGAAKRAELAASVDGLRVQVCRDPVAVAKLDELAAAQGLSAYDACYLELALRRGLPLATLDADLLKAMHRCGVPSADLAP